MEGMEWLRSDLGVVEAVVDREEVWGWGWGVGGALVSAADRCPIAVSSCCDEQPSVARV